MGFYVLHLVNSDHEMLWFMTPLTLSYRKTVNNQLESGILGGTLPISLLGCLVLVIQGGVLYNMG